MPEYEWRQAEWRKPLEKKALKREERAIREAEKEPVMQQDAIVYVHNAEVGVTIPAHPEQMFAVVRLMNRQYKVVKNDRIQVEKLAFEVG